MTTRPLLALIAVLALVLVGLVGVAAFALLSGDSTDSVQTAAEEATPAGRDSAPAPGRRVVARIDGIEITDADWTLALVRVDTNLNFMRGQIAAETQLAGGIAPFLALVEKYGAETVALGAVISQAVIEAEASRRGLMPTPLELSAAVSRQRSITEAALRGQIVADPGAVAMVEAMMAEVGEDFYWRVFLPTQQRQAIASERLQTAIGRAQSWPAFVQTRARAARVELIDPALRGISVSEALEYLEEFYRVGS